MIRNDLILICASLFITQLVVVSSEVSVLRIYIVFDFM